MDQACHINDSNLCLFHVLEGYISPIYKCVGLVRDGHALRDVRVKERIVEWIAEEHERAAEMPSMDNGNAAAKTVPVTPRLSPKRIGSSFVMHIDPSLSWMPTHVACDFAIGRTPRQPYGILEHARANLASAYQCLIIGRKALVNFRMLRNAVLSRLTTRENQRADCGGENQCSGKN